MKENEFLENVDSTLEVDSNYDKKIFDLEWLDKYEEVIPYIDNILRNPKRFLENQEEIVKVELAKKITRESVIHLTQHTSLIEDVSEDGRVRPSKVLNINKDETLDMYENRFIYTLVENMRMFFEMRVAEGNGESYVIDNKKIKYDGMAQMGEQKVRLSLDFGANEESKMDNDKNGETIADRLKRVKTQLDGFSGTELIQTLSKLHVAAVRSPIRKTNVILKNPNFQKATELWNYIQSYEGSGVQSTKDSKKYFDTGELKNKYDNIFLTAYLASVSTTNSKCEDQKETVKESFGHILESALEFDEELTENNLREMFNDKLKSVTIKIKKTRMDIAEIFNESFFAYQKQVKRGLKLLK